MPKIRQPDGNCIDCEYSMLLRIDSDFYACDYIGFNKKRRPCEYGWACTVKKPVKGRKRRIRPYGERE